MWKGFIHGVLSLIFPMFVRIAFCLRDDGITLVWKLRLLLCCAQMERNSLIFHILFDITTSIYRVHQESIFHISEPIYYEILEETRVLMKQAVFSTSHVNTSWDKRKNLAFIVIHNDE